MREAGPVTSFLLIGRWPHSRRRGATDGQCVGRVPEQLQGVGHRQEVLVTDVDPLLGGVVEVVAAGEVPAGGHLAGQDGEDDLLTVSPGGGLDGVCSTRTSGWWAIQRVV